MAELVKFSQSFKVGLWLFLFFSELKMEFFKLNKPIPDDLVPILAKDEEKQKLIREKASKDAFSAHARSIGVSSTTTSTSPSATRLAAQPTTKLSPDLIRKAGVAPPNTTKTSTTGTAVAGTGAPATPKNAATGTQSSKALGATKPAISMFIQAIPPFKGSKSRPQPTTSNSNGDNVNAPNGSSKLPSSNSTPTVIPSTPASPTTASINRLNVNASSFKPNPKANAFSPVATFYYR